MNKETTDCILTRKRLDMEQPRDLFTQSRPLNHISTSPDLQRDTFATTCTDASDNGDPAKWDYLLSAVVTHDLVTFNKSGSRTNRMRCVDSENKSILPSTPWPPEQDKVKK